MVVLGIRSKHKFSLFKLIRSTKISTEDDPGVRAKLIDELTFDSVCTHFVISPFQKNTREENTDQKVAQPETLDTDPSLAHEAHASFVQVAFAFVDGKVYFWDTALKHQKQRHKIRVLDSQTKQ